MKKLLQLSVLLVTTFCFGQAPLVNAPTLNTAFSNQLRINVQVNPNNSTVNLITIIYSTENTFAPQFTHEIITPATNLTGSGFFNVNGLFITCLKNSTNHFVKVRATNTSGVSTTSAAVSFSTTVVANPGLPELDSFASSNLTTNSATITLGVSNPLNAATTVSMEYSTSPVFANNPPTQSAANVTQALENRVINLTALQASTTYYVRVNLSNTHGCSRSLIYSFSTDNQTALLYHFPFDNSTSTSTTSPNSGTFTSTEGVNTFVANDQGNATGALFVNCSSSNMNTKKYTANLTALPVGNTSRSIVMRVNFLTYGPSPFNLRHFAVSWGTGTTNQSYGFEKIQTQGISAVWGDNKGIADGTSVPTLNNWVTYVITYDASTRILQYYINGGLRTPANLTHPNLSTVGTNIVLGSSLVASFGESNFNIDDLKIYSGALSQSQVTALSNPDFQANNINFSMFPNPANNILNIDLASDLQSVEIYSLQGQKVLTTQDKEINISSLSSGIYMVRVQDVTGSVATQKLIKE